MIASRDLHRFLHFGWNAARYALGPLAALLIPWVVMRHGTKALWGEVVSVMIGVQLASHFLRWGSREMLPRVFAERPTAIPAIWTGSVITRLWLVPPVAIILYFLVSGAAALAIVWLLLLFVNNSFEPLAIWRKRFLHSFVIDAAGLAITLTGLFTSMSPTLDRVLQWVIIGQAARTLMLCAVFRSDIPPTPKADARMHLAEAVPFLLIALSGLLGSRIDLYVMNLTTGREMLAEYQVVQGYFVQLQALAGIIAVPFTRELYRMGKAGVQKATGRLASLGLLALLPVGVIGQLLFTRFYGFDTDWRTSVAGCLVGWPVFAYTPMVQTLYKHGKETSMVIAGFITAGISAVLTWLLVPRFGITGGLVSAAISQFLMLLVVRSIFHRLAPKAR
jgi:O-antigen/teichoic acid export membrane protein